MPGTPYCTRAQARDAGAIGTDTQVDLAIATAVERVDAFTGDLFSPRTTTVVADLQPDGRAFLPYRITSAAGITAVVDADTDVAYAAAGWRAYSSADLGAVDSVGIGQAYVGSNILVVGLEPWNRTRWGQVGQVKVTGSFGWQDTPATVTWATAQLAAIIAGQMRQDDDANPVTPTPQTSTTTDPEGNVLPVVPPFSDTADQVEWDPATADRTTGSRKVDAALVAFRRVRPLMGV